MPAAGTKPLRTHVTLVDGARPTNAWKDFVAKSGGRWDVSWDSSTGVPARIFGSGILVPGASADPAIAEAAARRLLAQHLALLAPGAAIGDFELASNHWDGDQRSVGFIQRVGHRRVIGGQVSFRFKKDRVFVIGSEALPDVKISPSTTAKTAPLPREKLALRATEHLRAELALPNAPVSAPGDEVILPFVGDAAVLGYRVAVPMTIDGGIEGRYQAYVDPSTGSVLAVKQLNAYASGTISFRGVDRYPGRGRIDQVAPRLIVKLDGVDQVTGADGKVVWSPDGNKNVTLGVVGELVKIVDKAKPETATTMMALAPSGSIVWDATATETDDAQLVTYLAANRVKEFVRQHVDANLLHLDETLVANVNIQQNCNAYFDGTAINFFASSSECENTGRIDDVVFHEYGHGVHTFEIIEGVGSFDGAMSEGASDFLAASITNDPGMGRGFFRTDEALRDLDPPDRENIYPRDVGEIHTTGIIFGGTFWDLRKAFIAQYGEQVGADLTLKLYVGALRRATSIPTSLVEALAADDDDGDLANGTPNECAIRDAFGKHGMRTANGFITAPTTLDEHALATTVHIGITDLSRCPGDRIASATLAWRPTFTGVPAAGETPATRTGDNSFYGQLPLAIDEMTMYRATIVFQDQTEMTLANNLADPYYQVYQGHTKTLYCTNFDEDPFAHGWTSDGSGVWEWGTPPGSGPTDPPAAFSGSNVLAQALGKDYDAKAQTWVELPEIDVGHYSDVRLQYRRWLASEDSYYDQARILANGKRAWQNASAHKGDDSSLHHIDREWRFHDVPLSGYFTGQKLKVRFDHSSDEGLQLGGWAIDDVCVVANVKSICGDGVKSPYEVCDNGANNADAPDQCRTYCRLPTCGDNIVDSTEECDSGPDGSATCTDACEIIDAPIEGGCACQTGGGEGAASLLFGLGLLVATTRKRR